MLTKKDLTFSLVTGLTAGILGWWVLSFSGFQTIHGVSTKFLIVIMPIVWMIGVELGYILGRWFSFFNQFGKFAAVGFTNFTVDAAILDYLIFFTNSNQGFKYTIFKSISFFFGILHSYFWNKYWVFESSGENKGSELGKFILVALASAVVNVATASLVVNFVSPQLGLTANAWANVGSIMGSAVALIFSFIGFKVGVFKK